MWPGACCLDGHLAFAAPDATSGDAAPGEINIEYDRNRNKSSCHRVARKVANADKLDFEREEYFMHVYFYLKPSDAVYVMVNFTSFVIFIMRGFSNYVRGSSGFQNNAKFPKMV